MQGHEYQEVSTDVGRLREEPKIQRKEGHLQEEGPWKRGSGSQVLILTFDRSKGPSSIELERR